MIATSATCSAVMALMYAQQLLLGIVRVAMRWGLWGVFGWGVPWRRAGVETSMEHARMAGWLAVTSLARPG